MSLLTSMPFLRSGWNGEGLVVVLSRYLALLNTQIGCNNPSLIYIEVGFVASIRFSTRTTGSSCGAGKTYADRSSMRCGRRASVSSRATGLLASLRRAWCFSRQVGSCAVS